MSDEKLVDERSFNDAELEDIMNEIEDLEKEFVAPSPVADVSELKMDSAPISNEEDAFDQVVAENITSQELDSTLDLALEEKDSVDAELEAVANLKISEVEETSAKEEVKEPKEVNKTPTTHSEKQTNEVIKEIPKVLPLSQASPVSTPEPATEMSFNVAGHMNLKLHLNVGGEEIHLAIGPENGLEIKMANGASVTLPLASQISTLLKKAS